MEMKKNIQNWRNNIIWIFGASLFVMLTGEAISSLLPDFRESGSYIHTFSLYSDFIGIWISVLFAVLLIKENNFIKKHITIETEGNNLKNLFIGFILGFVLNGFSALVAILNNDINLVFVKFEVLPVLGLFFAVFIQSSAEEVLCRGFMYQRLLKANPKPIYAIILNSVFFSLLHSQNNGITILAFYDIFISGVFFSLIVFYYDSLWMAMAAHSTWNFTQSILLGLPNSGTSVPYSIFSLDANNVKQSFAYDVVFGLEGTIFSVALTTVCCVILYLINNKRKKIL